MKKQQITIGFVHNMFPVLSQTFISKEMLELQKLGLPVKIYSLTAPAQEQRDVTWPGNLPVDYIIPRLNPLRLLAAHFYFIMTSPWRYWQTLAFATRRRQSKSFFGKTLVAFAKNNETSKEQRQDMLMHLILAAPLARKMHRDRVTFINSHFADAAASFAMLAAKLLGLDYGVTTHAYDIFTPQYNLVEKLTGARFVLTCTAFNKTALLAGHPDIRPDSVKVLYHGINTAKFHRQQHNTESMVEIFSVGRLVPKKGFDILIDACALLRDRGHNFRCRIVGDGPMYEALVELIQQHWLQEEIELVGPLPSTAIKAYYEQADIFALPCVVEEDGNRDGIPNVIAEAMAMELPVVSSRISGIPELVVDGETGFLTEQRDLDAIVTALEKLIGDRKLAQQFGAAGRRRVLSVFDSQVCLQNLFDFYKKELSNSNSDYSGKN